MKRELNVCEEWKRERLTREEEEKNAQRLEWRVSGCERRVGGSGLDVSWLCGSLCSSLVPLQVGVRAHNWLTMHLQYVWHQHVNNSSSTSCLNYWYGEEYRNGRQKTADYVAGRHDARCGKELSVVSFPNKLGGVLPKMKKTKLNQIKKNGSDELRFIYIFCLLRRANLLNNNILHSKNANIRFAVQKLEHLRDQDDADGRHRTDAESSLIFNPIKILNHESINRQIIALRVSEWSSCSNRVI